MTTQGTRAGQGHGYRRVPPAIWLVGAVAAVTAFVAFRDGTLQMLGAWERKAECSHAYIIPLISLFLVCQCQRTSKTDI